MTRVHRRRGGGLGAWASALLAIWLCGPVRAAPPVPEGAAGSACLQQGSPRVEARLLVHPDDLDASQVRTGVWLRVSPGWHVAAAEPGDVGLPTTLDWSGSGGEVEDLPWPEPRVFEDEELSLRSYGYAGEVLLPARAHFRGAERRLRVALDVTACGDECIPGRLVLERSATPTPQDVAGAEGVRALWKAAVAAPRGAEPAGGPGLAVVLGLALLGGLLLNCMPCVLPVLALKVFALSQLASAGRRQALAHGLATAAGIWLSLLALALCVVALRAAGTAVGWGFQFQEPLYLAALGALLVLFALNLLGVFEIPANTHVLAGIGGDAVGARRSFFDGLLTVALATPCSAPFLGTALGLALAGPGWLVVAAFLAIGTGLAAPLLGVAAAPGLGRRLPRPGPWMLTLRGVLGFALLLTAVWLVWVTGRASGIDASAALLLLLLAISFGAWGFGQLQRRGHTPPPLRAALAAALLLALGLGAVRSELHPPQEAREALPAAPYTRARAEEALRGGRPVFLVFTADWCITCKANEHLVLADPRVGEMLELRGFAVLRADYTRRDEAIRAEIARLGRSGVPVYAVFDPRSPDRPRVLPEVLSVPLLLSALQEAGSGVAVTSVTGPLPDASMQQGLPPGARPEVE